MIYEVTKPLVVVRDEVGAQHMFYEGATFSSEGLDKDHVKMLVDEDFIVKASDVAPEGKPSTVKDILADVGDDKAKAQQYLDEESAAEKPRSSLVESLQAVLDAE